MIFIDFRWVSKEKSMKNQWKTKENSQAHIQAHIQRHTRREAQERILYDTSLFFTSTRTL